MRRHQSETTIRRKVSYSLGRLKPPQEWHSQLILARTCERHKHKKFIVDFDFEILGPYSGLGRVQSRDVHV